jgi:alkylated DNA nucleotide flippase Atl1
MAREGVPLNVIAPRTDDSRQRGVTLPVQCQWDVAYGREMSSIDFARARAFIDAIPAGRWAAYKDVARAGGNVRGAQAVGTWLRREGHGIALDYRVLTVEGRMPDTFRSAGWEAPADPASALAKLESEGVAIDDRGRAAQSQRFSATDWSQ